MRRALVMALAVQRPGLGGWSAVVTMRVPNKRWPPAAKRAPVFPSSPFLPLSAPTTTAAAVAHDDGA